MRSFAPRTLLLTVSFAMLVACGDDADTDPGAGGATAGTTIATSTTTSVGTAPATAATSTSAAQTSSAGVGGDPSCEDVTACTGNGLGAWVLETPCDALVPQQVPLYCADNGCITNLAACATSYVEIRRTLVDAHVVIGDGTFSFSLGVEQRGELHVLPACAAAFGAPSIVEGCTPEDLGALLIEPADACNVVGNDCVCTHAGTSDWTEAGTFDAGRPARSGVITTTSNEGTYDVPLCAGDEHLVLDVAHAPELPRRMQLSRQR